MSSERKRYHSVQEIPIKEVIDTLGIPYEQQDRLIYAADCIINTETNTFWDGSEITGDNVEFAALALRCRRNKAKRFLEEKFVPRHIGPGSRYCGEVHLCRSPLLCRTNIM